MSYVQANPKPSHHRRTVRDRERIADELNDQIINRLFSAGLALHGIVKLVEPDIVGQVYGVSDELNAIVAQVRSSAFALEARRRRLARW